jgi:hypothetical protein
MRGTGVLSWFEILDNFQTFVSAIYRRLSIKVKRKIKTMPIPRFSKVRTFEKFELLLINYRAWHYTTYPSIYDTAPDMYLTSPDSA